MDLALDEAAKEIKELANFELARESKADWIKLARESYAFVVGDQWEQEDMDKLTAEGKPALTLNKIQALIFLVSGIQRQNRTDFRAFPVGEEDSIKAEAITYILKDMQRLCDSDYKQSEQFEDGIICGEGWLEPWTNYEQDLIHGNLEFRKRSPFYVFPDPSVKEYNLSDARYVCVYTPNIDEDDLIKLFPSEKDAIADLPSKPNTGEIEIAGNLVIKGGYHDAYDDQETDGAADQTELPYEMMEYHYYEYEPRYIVVNALSEDPAGKYQVFEDEQEAQDILDMLIFEYGDIDGIAIIDRVVKVPNIKVFVNDEELTQFTSPFYPEYKKIPIFSFFAHWTQAPIKKKELQIQGIVGALKDPQREINKRHSQALHHLNTSTNSGWLSKKKGGISNVKDAEANASRSGYVLEYDTEKPEQIHPQPLSTGHETAVAIANADIKEISGLNTDLLAQNDKASSSGRAIHLRQQQGLMMIQRILDNFARTQREIGRFFISQIGLVYDIKKAQRAIGEAWIKEHFSKPRLVPRLDPHTGEPVMNPQTGEPMMAPLMDDGGQMVMDFDEKEMMAFFQMLLEDASLDRYDVIVGEVATSETVKLSNYTTLIEFAKNGIPIPPGVLIDESLLTNHAKERIKTAVAKAQANAQPQGPLKKQGVVHGTREGRIA